MEKTVTKTKIAQELMFVIGMWLLSRLVIVVVMQSLAPLLPADLMQRHNPSLVAQQGWQSFAHWDGHTYRRIVTSGYEFVNDGKQHNVAFFPLFPLITRAVMTLGLPFEVAGTLVNNLAFLLALPLAYFWVKERQGIAAARWTTVVLAWCPFSIFGTVTYTEGLFLLLSTASLRAFDRSQYLWASVWGAMATATRANGVALIPTFLIVAWRERRGAIAYVAAITTGTGLLLYILYCAIHFGDPLAFVQAQKGWQAKTGPNWLVWWQLFTQDLLGRKGLSTVFVALTKVVMVFGGGYLLWHLRSQIGRIVVVYGFCSLALIFYSGAILSVDRFSYGTVSLSIALGTLLARHQRWGYAVISLFALMLVYFSVRFAWELWIG